MKKRLSLLALLIAGSLTSSCVVALGHDAYPNTCDDCGKTLCEDCAQDSDCADCEAE